MTFPSDETLDELRRAQERAEDEARRQREAEENIPTQGE